MGWVIEVGIERVSGFGLGRVEVLFGWTMESMWSGQGGLCRR